MQKLEKRMVRLEGRSRLLGEELVTGIWLCGPDDEPASGRCAYLPVGNTELERQLHAEQAYQSQGLPLQAPQEPNRNYGPPD